VTAATVDPTDFSVERLRQVHRVSSDLVRRTPVLSSRSLSGEVGGLVALKAENLQRTGPFKLRGALAKLNRVDVAQSPGVVAGSAGNHAQSVAYAPRARGLACEIFMPAGASVSKLAAVRAFGATVIEGGASVEECVALARERAHETGIRSCIRSMTRRSSRVRRASVWSSSMTFPTSPGWWCRSAAAGLRRGLRLLSSSSDRMSR
jgi:threonine dehydratase